MKKIIVVLVISSLLLTSCNSDGLETNFPERNVQEGTPDKGSFLLLKKVTKYFSNEDVIQSEFSYAYDENDRLILETSRHYDERDQLTGGSLSSSTKYEYKDDRVIASLYKFDDELTSQFHYIKLNDNQEKLEIHNPDGESRLSRITYVNNTDCGVSKIEGFDRNGGREWFDTYEYTDSNCSFIVTTYSDEGSILGEDILTMDTFNSPYNSIAQRHMYETIPSHNVTRYVSKYPSGNVSITTNEFIYNSQDYPTSEIGTSISGPSKGSTFKTTYEYYE